MAQLADQVMRTMNYQESWKIRLVKFLIKPINHNKNGK